MGVIAKYKFNNTLEANLLPEFNSEFTSDLYTVTDEVNGEITTRTIESDSLPTLMRFGAVESSVATERSKSLLEIISLDISNCKNLYHNFRYCINLTTVNGLNIHNGITGLDNTFEICSSLEFVDTSNWDTSKVSNMGSMFRNCSKLTSLDVSGWDTSAVTKMGSMFYNCSNLTSLDVSGWDTNAVTTMYSMFDGCSQLTSLDVNGWDTGEVTNMSYIFNDCTQLTSLDVSSWDTSAVTNMSNMFSGCSQLTSLDLSGWDTSKLTDMGSMFYGCSQLTSLDVSGWDTSNVEGMYYIFEDCSKLTSLDLSSWDTSAVTDVESMFDGCSQLTFLNVSGWDTGNVTNMNGIFDNTSNLKYLKCNNVTTLNKLNTYLPTKSSASQGTIICKSDITNLDTTTLQSKYWNILDEPTLIAKYVFDKSIHNNCIPEFNTEFEGYFIEDEVVEGNSEVTRTIESCGMLPTLMRFGNNYALNNFNRRMSLLKMLNICKGLTSCFDMFAQCSNLISVCDIDTSNVTNMYCMFYECNKLTSLDVSNWDTSNVTSMTYMFKGCNKLTSLDVSNFNTNKVISMNNMFNGCELLTSLDVSNFDTSKVTDMKNMFSYCTNLTILDISNFNTSNVADMKNMFANTPLLTDISVLYMDKSSLQKLVDAMPTDLNKTLWYKDVNIDGITHGNNITLKKYMEGNVEIVLNSPLLEGDTIEVKDGKLCHYHKMGKVVLDGSESWVYQDATISCNMYLLSENAKPASIPMCDRFIGIPPKTMINHDSEGIGIKKRIDLKGEFVLNISKTKLSTQDENGFKQWLQQNPTTIIYELKTPYYEDITNLQSAPTLKTYLECSMEIDTDLPIDTNVTYRTNLSSVYVMERELDELDNGTDLGDILEGEVNE